MKARKKRPNHISVVLPSASAPLVTASDVELFHASDVHLATSTLYVGSFADGAGEEQGVDYQLADNVIKNLFLLDQNDRPINLLLNNLGGDVYHGLAIYDAIKLCHNPVIATVYGQALSMASLILQAATTRLMMPHSTLMIHCGDDSFSGHHHNFQRFARETARKQALIERIYAERSGIPLSKAKKLCAMDTWLTAEESVKYGLADGIVKIRN